MNGNDNNRPKKEAHCQKKRKSYIVLYGPLLFQLTRRTVFAVDLAHFRTMALAFFLFGTQANRQTNWPSN